jgi:hypothetical protein
LLLLLLLLQGGCKKSSTLLGNESLTLAESGILEPSIIYFRKCKAMSREASERGRSNGGGGGDGDDSKGFSRSESKRKKKGSKGAGSAKDALVADIKMNSYYDKKYKSEVGDDGLPSWAK